MAEIRSLAVHPYCQGKGATKLLLKALIKQAEKHRVGCVCLFTRIPDFFARLGFSVVNREQIPAKLYKDCCPCPKLRCCDEVAMLRGRLPTLAILGQPVPTLAKLEA